VFPELLETHSQCEGEIGHQLSAIAVSVRGEVHCFAQRLDCLRDIFQAAELFKGGKECGSQADERTGRPRWPGGSSSRASDVA
jgi:hypothetical protein